MVDLGNKNTPLLAQHKELGAKIVPFAGWNMPVQYQHGIIAEHNHTREKVSLFDICHMGEFRVKGPGAAEELDKILARTVINQKTGTCRYNFLLNERGTVLDDLVIYRLAEDEFLLVVNAGTIATDAEQISSNLPKGIVFTDESENTAKLDLQGPESVNVLHYLGVDTATLPKYFHWIETTICGIKCLLSRTGYTGELGFEIYTEASDVVTLWNKLLEDENVQPGGLGARDTLRLEMGYALYGHELDTETTPIDAGYGMLIKLENERQFIGSDALRANAPVKKLVGIELEGRRAAREGSAIYLNDKKIGSVTSGAFSPSLGKAIAMGYVCNSSDLGEGSTVELATGRARLSAKIIEMPFYKEGTARKKL